MEILPLVFDFAPAPKVGGTHLTYGYFKHFPVLPQDRYTEADLALHRPARARTHLHRARPGRLGPRPGPQRPALRLSTPIAALFCAPNSTPTTPASTA
ncbi:MAG: hypothetical protein IPJ18_20510 [Betaproteobacteria bacterium]|nr:hypothetical protein [Betaproteobacteria bacterium]